VTLRSLPEAVGNSGLGRPPEIKLLDSVVLENFVFENIFENFQNISENAGIMNNASGITREALRLKGWFLGSLALGHLSENLTGRTTFSLLDRTSTFNAA
jgi:hypothetical protein